jgi:hypothetical protein
MLQWSSKIKNNDSALADAVKYYTEEYSKAVADVSIVMTKLEREKIGTSHVFEHRLSQLQDIESMLKILNVKEYNLRRTISKKLLEDKQPKSNIDYIVSLDDNVLALELIINELALIRNLYLGILKGLHVKSASVNLCSKLRKDDTFIMLDYD